MLARAAWFAAAFAAGFVGVGACSSTSNNATPSPTTQPEAGTLPAGCTPCVTSDDCGANSVCAQFDGDSFCASSCANGETCGSGHSCITATTIDGTETQACLPDGDPCGPASSPAPPSSDATAPPSGQCGALVGPTIASTCKGCGTHTCQPNGCYGGWFCNTASSHCQAPPATCGGSSSGGTSSSSSGGPGPGPGPIGNDGGNVASLLFGVIGDTRPPMINDTNSYPSTIITKLFTDAETAAQRPVFMVATGDYQFSSPSGSQAAAQLDLYLAARSHYSGVVFPAMGNHECTGATASNCGQGATDGLTNNYNAFLSKLLTPLGKTSPNYTINVNATNGSWTSKFVFVAGNAWQASDATWLDGELAKPTTYTFVIRHEPKAATTAPGCTPSEEVMAKHPYTLAIVGHTHTYGRTGPKQVTIGNGGAPLVGSANYGYGLIQQRPDGAVQIDMIDMTTGAADTSFRFALKADGTPAP
jgi:hypothetical protein